MFTAASFAGPIATVIAAGVAAWFAWRLGTGQLDIARQQAETAKQQAELAAVRLQHDLFDRRFSIYEVTVNLLLEAVRQKNIPDDVYRAFVLGKEQAVFLLDHEIISYLSIVQERSTRLIAISDTLSEPAATSDDERKRLIDERAELRIWCVEQFQTLVQSFTPALALDQRRQVTKTV